MATQACRLKARGAVCAACFLAVGGLAGQEAGRGEGPCGQRRPALPPAVTGPQASGLSSLTEQRGEFWERRRRYVQMGGPLSG